MDFNKTLNMIPAIYKTYETLKQRQSNEKVFQHFAIRPTVFSKMVYGWDQEIAISSIEKLSTPPPLSATNETFLYDILGVKYLEDTKQNEETLEEMAGFGS